MNSQQMHEFARCVKLLNKQLERTEAKNDARLENIVREQRDIVETLAMLHNVTLDESESLEKMQKTLKIYELMLEKVLYLLVQSDLDTFIKIAKSYTHASNRDCETHNRMIYTFIYEMLRHEQLGQIMDGC